MLGASLVGLLSLVVLSNAQTVIQNSNPLIHYYGRWDTTQTSWWAGTGFKLNVQGLTLLSVDFGSLTVASTQIGISVNYGDWTYMNVNPGTTTIPLSGANSSGNTVVRIDSPQWQNNRMQVSSITLNSGATLLPYEPSKLVFQFIGDSLSAGQYLTDGVNQCWDFLTGEAFKAETTITAQPGIALTDVVSYENPNGMIVQFFDTEDTGYVYDASHSYTTPWNFTKDQPSPTHVVIYLGANDNGQNVAQDTFVQSYLTFLGKLRTIYPTQPIFILTDWGWPQPNGQVGYYYDGAFQQILSEWEEQGDTNTKLVDTTGWVAYADIQPSNSHPTVAGHVKIAGEFENWLKQNGVMPEASWPSSSGGGSSATGPSSTSVAAPPPPSSAPPPVSTPAGGSTGSGAAHWAQCGGVGFTGPTTCASPYTCTVINAYYSQCL